MNNKTDFLQNKLNYIFKAIEYLHGRVQKSLMTQVVITLLLTSCAIYFNTSAFFIAPYFFASIVFMLITLAPYLVASSAVEIKDNMSELKEAFNSSKLVLSDAKQIKSGKKIDVKSIVKHMEFIEQLKSLPELSKDAAGNIASLAKLVNPGSIFLIGLSQIAMLAQYIVLAISLIVFII